MNFYLSLLKQILLFPFDLIDKLLLVRVSIKGITFGDCRLGIISAIRGLINMSINRSGYKFRKVALGFAENK